MQRQALSNNPFPAEAVATFSEPVTTCSSLSYMRAVQQQLFDYLQAYTIESNRYGRAVGLRGGHGAGKTHMLGWVAETLRGAKTIRGTVFYGKCDSNRYSDLIYQLLKQLTRPVLIELVQLALL